MSFLNEDVSDLLTSNYLFDLPESAIAQFPVEPRDHARLLVMDGASETLAHHRFDDLPTLLNEGDLLVVNNTRVIPARLYGEKLETGAKIEFLLLRPLEMNRWLTLVKPGKRLRDGHQVSFGGGKLIATVEETTATGERIVSFAYDGNFMSILSEIGEIPFPPYVTDRRTDAQRYQTVYASAPGSAAAPTAGLHFTPRVFEALRSRGIESAEVTLHIGLGTFRPVEAEKLTDHVMHSEWYEMSAETAERLTEQRSKGGRIIAVGTTSSRVLESIWRHHQAFVPAQGTTDIFIYPGYRFGAVDGLITNFHLPGSSLLMLISALAGREFILSAYSEAIKTGYRFYSFGDACLIWPRSRHI